MSDCLGDAELGAFSRGELSAAEAARVQAHLDRCPTCYAQLLRGDRHDTGEDETGEIRAPGWAGAPVPGLDWQPGRDLGRYVILQTLGKGGMGVVYRAYDKELDRAVALKVLHQERSADGTSAGATRLLREAQAMARLSHPNVVTVHDVVVLEQRVCVVMELVEGTTVREWLNAEPRPGWKAIVEVFRAAGEGLAAAHDAQLVHRDFKPENVLVGRDGRIRVTDFGIARLAGNEVAGAVPSPPEQGGLTLGSTLGSPITREGQVVGTPRYMAPEQFEKAPTDFRTDQFSFAVSLYEALHGQHPFAGASTAERLEHAKRGEVQDPPSSSSVPLWVHRLLVRALAADPARRFPSLRELTSALGRDPSQRRRRALAMAAVGLALGLAVVAVVHASRTRAELCTGSERLLEGIWDPGRRAQIQAAFAATKLPFSEESFSRAADVLDRYTAGWVDARKEACEATSVRGEQSEAVLTLRMACLQERLDAVAALTELFTRADARIVGKAKQSLDELPRLATCADVKYLSARLPPPEDPKAAAEVERIRREITRSQMLLNGGRAEEAEKLIRPALEAARHTGYSPVQAEAEFALGRALSVTSESDEAAALFRSAFARALADGNEEMITLAAMRMAQTAFRRHEDELALEWADFGEAANRRTRDPEYAALVSNARGNVARNRGDFVKAAKYYGEGAELARETLGPENMTTLGLSYNHASALQNLGHFREASGEYSRVIDTARRTMGPHHPFLAYPLVGAGLVALYQGKLEASKASFEEVLAVTGGHGLNADNAYAGLGEIALAQGRYDDALQAFRQAEQVDAVLYPGGVEGLQMRAQQGQVMVEQGYLDQALALFEDVLAKAEKRDGAFDASSTAKLGEARILLARGKPEKALPLADAAVAILVSTRGKTHPVTLDARLVRAEVRWEQGARAEAKGDAEAVLTDTRVELGDAHPLAQRAKALIARP